MLTRRTRILADRREGRIIRPLGWQKPIRGTMLNRGHRLARGLVAGWLFNELGSSILFDATGNGQSAEHRTSGSASTAEWIGDYINFDDTDYLQVDSDGKLVEQFTSEMSILVTFNADILTGWDGLIIKDGSTTWPSGYGMDFYASKCEFWVAAYGTRVATNALSLYTWYTVVATFRRPTMSIYIDGILHNTNTHDVNVNNSVGDNLVIAGACDNTAGSFAFDGRIKLVYMWNRCLSAAEVALLHREPYAMFQHERRVSILTPLYRFWPEDAKSLWYSKGNYSALPTDDADLEDDFEGKDYENVELDDNVYVAQSADNENAIFQFKEQHSNRTDPISVTWKGKTTKSGGGRIIRALGWQKPVRGMQLDRTHDLAKGLVGCWAMNEGSGNPFNLITRKVSTLFNANAPAWGEGGIVFTGTEGLYELGDIGEIATVDKLSLMIIVKVTNVSASRALICGSDNSSTPSWLLRITSTDEVNFYSSGVSDSTTTSPIVLGQKHTIAISHDGGNVRIYVDGKEEADEVNNLSGAVNQVDIGFYDSPTMQNPFIGTIYCAYIWNRALLASEIALLYREPYCMFQTTRRFVGINPVHLQVRNYKQSKWVTVDTENNAIADEEFTLEGSLS